MQIIASYIQLNAYTIQLHKFLRAYDFFIIAENLHA